MMPDMARVVFALCDPNDQTDAQVRRLLSRHQGMGPFSLQTHRQRLDPLTLPDAATVLRRNLWIYVVGGLILGLSGGLAAALFLPLLPGLGGWTFPVAGSIAGIIVGILCASMAGAREPKKSIADAADALSEGKTLVTVLVHNRVEQEHVQSMLSETAQVVDVC